MCIPPRVASVAVVLFGLCACRWGSRNGAGGNPDLERRLVSCTAGAWEVRLYRGDGGATTAYWSTVTVERPGLPERQVYFAYGFPLIDALQCSPDRVELVEAGVVVEPIEERRLAELRETPISIWKGRRQ
ncbi:MAG: hypothetical protein R3F61_24205 [Myxococcota bacterium]